MFFWLLIPKVFGEFSCDLTFTGGCREFGELQIGPIHLDKYYSPEDCFEKCKDIPECAGFVIRRGTCSLVAEGCTSNFNPYYQFYDLKKCFKKELPKRRTLQIEPQGLSPQVPTAKTVQAYAPPKPKVPSLFDTLVKPTVSLPQFDIPELNNPKLNKKLQAMLLMKGPPVQLKSGKQAPTENPTPDRFENVLSNINNLIASNADKSFVKLAKRIVHRLGLKQNSIFKRIESRISRCDNTNISEVSRVKTSPIRNVCDLIDHYFTDIRTEVNSFFAKCPQKDNFGDKTRIALDRLDKRLTRKFEC